MNKRKNRAAALLALLLALGGCTKETESPAGPAAAVPLEIVIEGITAPEPAASKAALANGSTVRVIAFKHKSGSGSVNYYPDDYVADQAFQWSNSTGTVRCVVDEAGKPISGAGARLLKLIPGNYDIVAISPALPLDIAAETGIRVAVDNGMDYAASASKAITVPETDGLRVILNPLERQCSRIDLRVNIVGGGTVTGLTINGLCTPAPTRIFPLPEGSTGNGSLEFSYAPADWTYNGFDATLNNPLVVLPLRGDITIGLTVRFDDGTLRSYASTLSDILLERGKRYTLNGMITSPLGSSVNFTLTTGEPWTNNNGNNTTFENSWQQRSYPYWIGNNILVHADKYGGWWNRSDVMILSYISPYHKSSTTRHQDIGNGNALSAAIEIDHSGLHGSDVTYAQAKDYCASKGTGWRLPTAREGYALVMDEKWTAYVSYPRIALNTERETYSAGMWTSTTEENTNVPLVCPAFLQTSSMYGETYDHKFLWNMNNSDPHIYSWEGEKREIDDPDTELGWTHLHLTKIDHLWGLFKSGENDLISTCRFLQVERYGWGHALYDDWYMWIRLGHRPVCVRSIEI